MSSQAQKNTGKPTGSPVPEIPTVDHMPAGAQVNI